MTLFLTNSTVLCLEHLKCTNPCFEYSKISVPNCSKLFPYTYFLKPLNSNYNTL